MNRIDTIIKYPLLKRVYKRKKYRVFSDGVRLSRRKRGGSQGRPITTFSVSMPVDELREVDEFAEKHLVERSLLIREALKLYMEKR